MVDRQMPKTVELTNQWLKSQSAVTAIASKRISYRLTGGTYPAIRVTDLGPITHGPEEDQRRIQIECWASDYDDAEDLARAVVAAVDNGTMRGEWPAGYCAGAAVISGPFSSPDSNSQRHRHQLDIAAWLYPSIS